MIMMPTLIHTKIIMGIAVMLFSVNAFAVDLQKKTDLLVDSISIALPDKWRVEIIENPKKAWWMFYNESEFIEIRLVGPKMSGFRYILQSEETKDILFRNEAIYLWITPSSFDDGWTFWRRFRYRLTITYTKLPDVIPTRFGLKIYVEPGWFAVEELIPEPGKYPYPARPIYETGAKKGSWPDWKADIAKAVK
jgi:hypothetical protein